MKNVIVRKGAGFSLVLLLMAIGEGEASVIFSDNFTSGPSPLWGNENGSWTSSGGVYYATAPNNSPNAYSSVPYSLRDFSVDFDINDVSDGGVFLRATPVPGSPLGVKGILLNLKVPDGGSRLYWHIFYDGTNASPPLNVVYLDYGTTIHVHVEVAGDTYSAFINGSADPAIVLTTSAFSTGRVALYDFSGQTFSNFVLEKPQPSLFIGMDADAAVISWSTDFPEYVLQTTSDLSLTSGWSSFAGPYASTGGSYQFRLPLLNILHKQFFRLSARY